MFCVLSYVIFCTSLVEGIEYFATANVYQTGGRPSSILGVIKFRQTTSTTYVTGTLTGISPANQEHSFHIHQKGDFGHNIDCKLASGHFNPTGAQHGAPMDYERHIGDLGNIKVDSNGMANVSIILPKSNLPLSGSDSVIGRAVVLHKRIDDLGTGSDSGSKSARNAGSQLGCGVIRIASENLNPAKNSLGKDVTIDRLAGVTVMSPEGDVYGEITIQQKDKDTVVVAGKLTGVKPDGNHGFHVHALGDITTNCKSAKGHFNPDGHDHGGPTDKKRHIGDLGNIEVIGGSANVKITLPSSSLPLVGPKSIVGRAIVLHAGFDDLGKRNEPDSKTTGYAGARLGCGVIGIRSNFTIGDEKTYKAKAVMYKSGVVKAEAKMYKHGDITSTIGTVSIVQYTEANRVILVLTDLHIPHGSTASAVGFHIHTLGSIGTTNIDCVEAMGHFNPQRNNHAAPYSARRHIGDLGNLNFTVSGISRESRIVLPMDKLPLTGPHSVIGRALVLHNETDDLGLGGFSSSITTGNAGSRYACGTIGIKSMNYGAAGDSSGSDAVYPRAVSTLLVSSEGAVLGKVTIKQTSSATVTVTGELRGITANPNVPHGMHIHELGDTGNNCYDSLKHYNPAGETHGGVVSIERHIGDLGNINVFDGAASINITLPAPKLPLVGQYSIVGRVIDIHEIHDDLGYGWDIQSKISGNAGTKIACGILGISSDFSPAGSKANNQRGFTALGASGMVMLTMLHAFEYLN